jgi:hypothetical protein
MDQITRLIPLVADDRSSGCSPVSPIQPADPSLIQDRLDRRGGHTGFEADPVRTPTALPAQPDDPTTQLPLRPVRRTMRPRRPVQQPALAFG